MSDNQVKEPVPWVETEEQDGVDYIKPNLDMKLRNDQKETCREIVMEIRRFGVSQRQLLYIINLLALELENTEVMKAVREAVSEHREKVGLTKQDTAKPLILGK